MAMVDEITSSSPLKRSAPDDDEHDQERPLNLKGTQFLIPTPPTTNDSPSTSLNDFKRELSPAGSISTLSSIQDVSSIGGDATVRAPSSAPPAKKRKLTVAEKAEKERLKVVKAQEKEVLKVKKEEEKRIKDEEKRVKDEEKRQKAEEKEAKKREKELEEERKVQEKLKKERSQMRLGAFFQKPVTSNDTARDASPDKVMPRRRSLSLELFDTMQVKTAATASGPEPQASTPVVSDYRKYFLPWEPKPYTILPASAVVAGSDEAQAQFDAELHTVSAEQFDRALPSTSASIDEHFRKHHHARGRQIPRVKDCMEQLDGSQNRPVDLTNQLNPFDLIAIIPTRYLHFKEDVRPDYCGTYTAVTSPRAARKLRRNPFSRQRQDTDYDIDSEAEWEDPGEGEDIDANEEDDESIGDDEEMEGFLDDEDDELKARRKLVVTDLRAQCSGICWQNRAGKLSGERPDMMKDTHMQFLLPNFKGKSVDPFSTSYWEEESKPDTTLLRPPLKERSTNSANVKLDGWPIASQTPGPKKGSKPGTQKSMNAEEMEAFRTAIVGSALGKQELVVTLKNLFPNLTAVFVKETLSEKFAQVGKSKSDKKWVYVGTT